MESLRLLSYVLGTSLEAAIANRPGFRTILRKGAKIAVINIAVEFSLMQNQSGSYLVELEAPREGPILVVREECLVETGTTTEWFKVSRGTV